MLTVKELAHALLALPEEQQDMEAVLYDETYAIYRGIHKPIENKNSFKLIELGSDGLDISKHMWSAPAVRSVIQIQPSPDYS